MKFLIVEIRYLFGLGGIIIVCRVFWDLYKVYFCVFIDISFYCYFEEDKIFLNEIVERVVVFEEICNIVLIILMDGK